MRHEQVRAGGGQPPPVFFFGAERVVFDGKTSPLNFSVDEDYHVIVDAQTIGQLGAMRAIRRYIAQADINLPPFAIAPDAVAT